MRREGDLEISAILRALLAHDVRFIVVGGVAANMHGSGMLTRDLDIVYSRERANIRRLAAALIEIAAQRADLPEGVRAPVDEREILNGTNFRLRTRYGRLDVIGETPSGRYTYEALFSTAKPFGVDDLTFLVVSVKNLRRMKRAAGRPKDVAALSHLSALDDEIELQEARAAYRRGTPTAALERAARRGRARPARRGRSRTRAR
jgi:hypothetical protein